MAIQATPYDLANLQQITQGGGAFLDYLKNQREQQDQARNAQQRLESALALQQSENAGGVQRVEAAGRLAAVQGDLNRQNALAVVTAQEHARVAAQRAASISGLQARYPRKEGEDDDTYMERVGKAQAEGPNKIYRQSLALQAAAETKTQKLQRDAETALADAEKQRRPKIEAAARRDPDLFAAYAASGGKEKIVPANMAASIQRLRSQKLYDKADALESAWNDALLRADDPKLVPYSVEIGTRIKSLNDEIASIRRSTDKQVEQMSETRHDLIHDPYFRGGAHLEFNPAEPAPGGRPPGSTAPLGPPASLAPPPRGMDRASKLAFGEEILGGAPAALPPAPPGLPTEGVIPNAVQGVNEGFVQPLVGLNNDIAGGLQDLAPSRSQVAPFLSELRGAAAGAGDALGAARRTLIRAPGEVAPTMPDPLSAYLGAIRAPLETGGRVASAGLSAIGEPVSETMQGLASYIQPAAWNNDPTALPYPRSYTARRAATLFGADALKLLAQAKQVGLQRGVPPEETQKTFDRAIAGDAKAIGNVRNFFNMLRMGPIQDEPHGPPIDSRIQDEPMGPPIDSTIRDEPMAPMIVR